MHLSVAHSCSCDCCRGSDEHLDYSICVHAGLKGQMWFWMILGKTGILLLSLASLAVKHKRMRKGKNAFSFTTSPSVLWFVCGEAYVFNFVSEEPSQSTCLHEKRENKNKTEFLLSLSSLFFHISAKELPWSKS